jgi:thioredoxin 1
MRKNQFIFNGIIILSVCIYLIAAAETDSLKISKAAVDSSKAVTAIGKPLPKLVDLGSKSCIPCKKMAPILDSLREEYKGRAEIVFIDTREDRKAASEYKIAFIPTQVFIDTTGKEIFRHVGFFPADSITLQLKAMGVK